MIRILPVLATRLPMTMPMQDSGQG